MIKDVERNPLRGYAEPWYDLAGQVAMRHSAAITQSSTPTPASNSQQICCNAMKPHKAIVLPNPNRVSFNGFYR